MECQLFTFVSDAIVGWAICLCPTSWKGALPLLLAQEKIKTQNLKYYFLLSAYHTANIINQVTISQARGLGNVYEYRTTCQIFQQTFEVMILGCPWREHQHDQKKIKQSQHPPLKKTNPTLNGLTINLKLVFYIQHTFFFFIIFFMCHRVSQLTSFGTK